MLVDSRKWLVTGHMGFIGSHLFSKLRAPIGVDIKIKTPASKYQSKDPVDVICHLAATSGIQDCEADLTGALQNNVKSMAIFRGVKFTKGIAFSSMAVHNPSSIYAATKLSSEIIAKALGNISIIRPANIFGPGSLTKGSVIAAWCREAIRHGTITVHGGAQLRDFIYIDDIIDAIFKVSVADTGTYEAGTGIARPVMEVAEMMEAITGASIKRLTSVKSESSEPADIDALESIDWTVDRSESALQRNLAHTHSWFVENYAP